MVPAVTAIRTTEDTERTDYTEDELDKLLYADSQKVVLNYMNNDINATYEGLAVRFMRLNVKTDKETSKAGAKKLPRAAAARPRQAVQAKKAARKSGAKRSATPKR